ncbi:MAG: hypothetical protein ACPGYV_14420, partial [Phycisphaeraceae bacterium]
SYDTMLEDRQTSRKADLDVQARQGLPPFEDMVLEQFVGLMQSAEYSLPQKAGIWQLGAPLLNGVSDQRALLFEAYAMMLPSVRTQAAAEGWGDAVTANFPQPRGFQEWYQQNVARPALPQPAQPDSTR